MGKTSYVYTDSDTEDTSFTSLDDNMKKKKFSILKYTNNAGKKKKCKVHSKSEPDDSDRSRSRSRSKQKYRLTGILKHPEKDESSDEDDDIESIPSTKQYIQSRCLVGRVPRPAGAKPGRGGGVAIIVRKNASSIPAPQISTSSQKKTKFAKRLLKKRSY